MDESTKRKWDFSSSFYDLLAYGPERRWAPDKRELFANMHGKVLFVAVGTGQDIPFFPPGRDIVGIDISPRMLAKATEPRRELRRDTGSAGDGYPRARISRSQFRPGCDVLHVLLGAEPGRGTHGAAPGAEDGRDVVYVRAYRQQCIPI